MNSMRIAAIDFRCMSCYLVNVCLSACLSFDLSWESLCFFFTLPIWLKIEIKLLFYFLNWKSLKHATKNTCQEISNNKCWIEEKKTEKYTRYYKKSYISYTVNLHHYLSHLVFEIRNSLAINWKGGGQPLDTMSVSVNPSTPMPLKS